MSSECMTKEKSNGMPESASNKQKAKVDIQNQLNNI